MPLFWVLALGGAAYALLFTNAGNSWNWGTAKKNQTPPPLQCPPAGTKDLGAAALPAPWRALVMGALSSPIATKEALMELARQLQACGQNRAALEVLTKASTAAMATPVLSSVAGGYPFPKAR